MTQKTGGKDMLDDYKYQLTKEWRSALEREQERIEQERIEQEQEHDNSVIVKLKLKNKELKKKLNEQEQTTIDLLKDQRS